MNFQYELTFVSADALSGVKVAKKDSIESDVICFRKPVIPDHVMRVSTTSTYNSLQFISSIVGIVGATALQEKPIPHHTYEVLALNRPCTSSKLDI